MPANATPIGIGYLLIYNAVPMTNVVYFIIGNTARVDQNILSPPFCLPMHGVFPTKTVMQGFPPQQTAPTDTHTCMHAHKTH